MRKPHWKIYPENIQYTKHMHIIANKEIEQSVELTEDCATKLNLNDLASQKKFEYSSSSS